MKNTFHTVPALLLLTLQATAEVKAEPELRAPTSVSSSAFFGPVIERVINHPDNDATNYFLDLDSDTFIEAPDDIFSQLRDRLNGVSKRGRPNESLNSWTEASGADLMIGKTAPELTRVLYGGLISFPVHSFTKTDAQTVLRIANEAAQHGASRPPISISTRLGLEGDAAVFFQTREGGMGLLQIVGTTENPRSVKIRYKLLASDLPKTAIQNRDSVSYNQTLLIHPKADAPSDVTEHNLKATPALRPDLTQPSVPTKSK